MNVSPLARYRAAVTVGSARIISGPWSSVIRTTTFGWGAYVSLGADSVDVQRCQPDHQGRRIPSQ